MSATDDDVADLSKRLEQKAREVGARTESKEDPCWDGYTMVGQKPNGDPRCVPEDEVDNYQGGESGISLAASAEVPMIDDAQLLYPDEGQAEAAAEELGMGATAHPHDLDGDTWYMPGDSHQAFEDAVSDMAVTSEGFADYDDFDACVRANSDKDDPEAYCASIKREVEGKAETPEGVPEGYEYVPPDEEPPEDYDVVESPNGATYVSPEPVERGEGSEGGGSGGVFNESSDAVFQEITDESTAESVSSISSSWAGWPTDSSAAAIWTAAAELTSNENDPGDVTGSPLVDSPDADPEDINAYIEYKSNLEEKLREEHGDEVESYRFLHGEAAEKLRNGENIQPRTLGSWTDNPDTIDDLIGQVTPDPEQARESGVVVKMDIPVENIMDHHDANPELDDADQDEVIAALDWSDDLQDGDLLEVGEL